MIKESPGQIIFWTGTHIGLIGGEPRKRHPGRNRPGNHRLSPPRLGDELHLLRDARSGQPRLRAPAGKSFVAGSVTVVYPGVVGEVPIALRALNGSSLVTPPGSALIAALNCDQAAVVGLPVTWP